MWKDSETEIDFLDFSYIVEIMKDTINDEKLLPSCIGLYGDWGSGKSSLMHMCKRQLEQQNDGTVCLLFNGWLYESYDDAKTAILASILDGIKEGRNLQGAAKITLKALYDSIDKFKVIKGGIKFGIDMAVTGGLGAITNLTIKEITKKAKKVVDDVDEEATIQAIKDKLDYKEVREDIREFREKFAELIKEASIKKLVIFVDELDRCKPSFTVRLLEQIKHYMHDERITYVLSINTEELQHTIKNSYGDSFDACRYLDRFFYLRINLPPVDKKKFYMNIELNGRYYLEIISRRIIDVYNMQLREITRFYRQVRTAAYVPTHDDEKWNCIFPDGEARQFMLSCIVPIIIGLKMVDISMYEQFISGKSGKPMVDILNTKEFSTGLLCRFLKEDESFSQIEKKKLITPEEKILEIYNAIFVNKYSGNDYQKTIGKCEFDADSRKFVLVAASMLSQYANYEI